MTFKILNSHGREIGQADTFKQACEKGMSLSPDYDFAIKEGARKSEIINTSMRDWLRWWYSPKRKVVSVDGGFRLL